MPTGDRCAFWMHSILQEPGKGKATMAIHRKILEWQAANPTMTWIFWGIIWAIVFYLLFRPNPAGGV